jgi:hypothetical protein
MGILTFHECLERAAQHEGNKHILLGNGFSMELNKNTFSYTALHEKALSLLKGEDKEKTAQLFNQANSSDFELVLKQINNAINLIKIECPQNTEILKKLKYRYEKIRDCLIETISKNHPSRPSEIEDWQYDACQKFIKNFKNIYTINYDLTLYWALMHNYIENSTTNFIKEYSDGFSFSQNLDETYVVWDIKQGEAPKLQYLHGALHIFDSGDEIIKYTWKNTGEALVDQIKESIDNKIFPIFISEGTAENKISRIQHSSILSKGYRSLSSIGGTLFTFGFSFSDNDQHIIDAIFNSKIKNLFIGVHQGKIPQMLANKIKEAEKKRRSNKSRKSIARNKDINIEYYNTDTAKAWG